MKHFSKQIEDMIKDIFPKRIEIDTPIVYKDNSNDVPLALRLNDIEQRQCIILSKLTHIEYMFNNISKYDYTNHFYGFFNKKK